MSKPSPLSRNNDPSDPTYKWWETDGPTKRVYTEVLVEKLTQSPRKSALKGSQSTYELPKRVTIMPITTNKDEETYSRPLSRSRSFRSRPNPSGPIRETTIHLTNAGLLSARTIPDGREERNADEGGQQEENRFKVVIKKIEDVIMKEKSTHDKMSDATQSAELIILIRALAKEMELLYGKVNEFSDSLNKLKKDFGLKEEVVKPEPIKPKTDAFRVVTPPTEYGNDSERKGKTPSPKAMLNARTPSPKTSINGNSPFQRSNSSLTNERQTEKKESSTPTQQRNTTICPYVSPYRKKYGNLTVNNEKPSTSNDAKKSEPQNERSERKDMTTERQEVKIMPDKGKDFKRIKPNEENDKKPYIPGMSLVLSGWNRIQSTSYSRPSPLASPSCSERESDGEMTEEEIQTILKSATSKYLDNPGFFEQCEGDRNRKKN